MTAPVAAEPGTSAHTFVPRILVFTTNTISDPGVDLAGTVVETGEGVTGYAVGDEVFGSAVPRVLRALVGALGERSRAASDDAITRVTRAR